MILMNTECAKQMCNFNDGIYRSLSYSSSINKTSEIVMPNEISDFIKIWHSSSGNYTSFINKQKHDLMNNKEDYYIHITSPIRRLVDLLNMMKLLD